MPTQKIVIDNFIRKAVKFMLHRLWQAQNNATQEETWRTVLDKETCLTPPKSPLRSRQRILYGPSFSIHDPCFALDRIISKALSMQGMEVIPMYCDGIQDVECNVFGGLWNGGTSFKANCELCQKRSHDLWNSSDVEAARLSSAVTQCDKDEIRDQVNRIADDKLLAFEANEIPFGKLAKDITVNNFLAANIKLVPNHTDLLRQQIGNLMLCEKAYKRVIAKTKPDIIISNDSYYGMWRVLQELAKKMDIPFYSHWPVTIDRIAVAKDDAAMNLNMRACWDEYQKIELTPEDLDDVTNWLKGNRNLSLDTTTPEKPETVEPLESSIDPQKPTILLAANVIWDLAALDKQVIFSDMISWITETITWFSGKADWQLIVKPHPAETFSGIPTTTEKVEDGIRNQLESIPKNVIVLKPNTPLTVLRLLELSNIRAAIVHTTTVGYELPAQGIPAIVTGNAPYRGFGFTVDPETKKEYFASIEKALQSRLEVPKAQSDLAKKFTILYQFRYYAKHRLFDGKQLTLNPDLTKSIEMPEGAFGNIIDSILAHKPIISPTTWPPKS